MTARRLRLMPLVLLMSLGLTALLSGRPAASHAQTAYCTIPIGSTTWVCSEPTSTMVNSLGTLNAIATIENLGGGTFTVTSASNPVGTCPLTSSLPSGIGEGGSARLTWTCGSGQSTPAGTSVTIAGTVSTAFTSGSQGALTLTESSPPPTATATPTPITGSPPAAPSNVQVRALDASDVLVTWSDNSNDETGFDITIDQHYPPAGHVGANVTSYTWGGLSPNFYVCFSVRAVNNYGASAYTNWSCTTTLAGSPPTPTASPQPTATATPVPTAVCVANCTGPTPVPTAVCVANCSVTAPAPTPVIVPGPSGPTVTYPAGWNLAAGPTGTVLRGAAGALYTLQANDSSYEVLPVSTPLQDGWGYWAYFPSTTTVTQAASIAQTPDLANSVDQEYWCPPSGNSSVTISISVLCVFGVQPFQGTGTYTLTVTGGLVLSCPASQTGCTVTAGGLPTPTLPCGSYPQTPGCPAASGTTLTLSANAGTGPYVFVSVSGPALNATLSIVGPTGPAGTYSFSVVSSIPSASATPTPSATPAPAPAPLPTVPPSSGCTAASVSISLPANHYVMGGNAYNGSATVSGADVVYSYNATQGYSSNTTLNLGQGAWLFSRSGGTASISCGGSSSPTPSPSPTPTAVPVRCEPNDATWAFDAINVAGAWAQFPGCTPPPIPSGGSGNALAIFDTGIDTSAAGDLDGRIGSQFDYTSLLAVFSVPRTAPDGDGHGTADAGIILANANNSKGIAGVDPNATADIYKVAAECSLQDPFGCIFRGSADSIATALQTATGLGTRVINMSAGMDLADPCSGGSGEVEAAVSAAEKANNGKGVLLVVSAGNFNVQNAYVACGSAGASGNNYLAALAGRHNNVLVVTAANKAGGLAFTKGAAYSNYEDPSLGGKNTIGAPGGDCNDPLISIFPKGLSAGYCFQSVTCPGGNTGCSNVAGTSQAAPQVTGVVALMLAANSSLSAPDLIRIIQCTKTPWSNNAASGTVDTSKYGPGIVNAQKAVQEVFSELNGPGRSAGC